MRIMMKKQGTGAPPTSIPRVTEDLLFYVDSEDSASYSGSGNVWYDLSGNGNDFTWQASPTYDGKSFVMNGAEGDEAYPSNPTSFSYNRSSFTVEAWANQHVDWTPWYGAILAKWTTGGGSDNEFSLGASSTGQWAMHLDFPDGQIPDNVINDRVLSTTTIDWNTWYHVVGTFDNGVMKLYVNGQLEDTETTVQTTVQTTNAYMGINAFGQVYESYGLRNKVAMYNRALTAEEVLQNYNATKDQFVYDVEVAGVIGVQDGTDISANSTVAAGGIYLGRDFWTFAGQIGGHGNLNASMNVVFDAGIDRVWSSDGLPATVWQGDQTTYPYLAKAYWYMSDDNATWTLVGSTNGTTVANTTETLTLSSTVKKRYLRIVHDVQPLNGYSLSNAAYQNLDIKIMSR